MEYKIDSADQIIDEWVFIFEALSITQFAAFADDLEFPVPYPAELKQISKDFATAVLTVLDFNPPESPSTPLYDSLEQIDPLLQIWRNVFSKLEALGVANEIYSWGRQIQKLSRGEAYHVTSITDWDLLLTQWTHDPTNPKYQALLLSSQTIDEIQSIVKNYHESIQQIRARVERLREGANNSWDNYIFNTLSIGSWINNTTRTLLSLSKWKSLFSMLSPKELEILDKWGYSCFNAYNYSPPFSIVQFANDLSA